ncbi:MAG: hydroxymethylpyrimidine/phosphomethylpyrimidine kinase, partial [Candidatus Dormibacteraeota bacterium]|nr:hydroxymethylpyrimidine/phosphomethylpyrimidine kinase [Candidatus Dormibacteraeota bacterium]
MVAKGGHRLLAEDAVTSLREHLLPLATIVTPNLPEAEVLLGRPIATAGEREAAARDLVALGCRAAVVKGGHAEGDADDVLCDGERVVWLRGERVDTGNTHGSGCTFASAIAAGLARGLALEAAVREAKRFVTGAIRASLEIGGGHGPVNPLWELLPEN